MNKIKNMDKIKFLIFIVFAIIALVVIIMNWNHIKGLRIEKFVHFIRKKGRYAIIVYLLIFAIKPFFVIVPSNLISIAGGILFGPVEGFILSMVGFFISGTVAFHLSQFLGKNFVQSIVGDRFIKLDDKLNKNGFKILFLLRLPPILPYDPLSYACGFTNIKYRDFILASVFGVVVETLCFSILGPSCNQPFSLKFMIPFAILILVTVFSKKIMDMKKK
jgi:uncharacterized membrane protein YdjX (TVP38/TMEM64 family)